MAFGVPDLEQAAGSTRHVLEPGTEGCHKCLELLPFYTRTSFFPWSHISFHPSRPTFPNPHPRPISIPAPPHHYPNPISTFTLPNYYFYPNDHWRIPQMKVLGSNANSLSLSKPPLLALLTNVGENAVSSWGVPNAGFSPNAEVMEVLTCTQMQADAQGGINARTSTGQPMVCFMLPFPFNSIPLFLFFIYIYISTSVRSVTWFCIALTYCIL